MGNIKIIIKGILVLQFLTVLMPVKYANTKYETAIFAGGCFWCMQPPFEKLNGVKEVISGYTGGSGLNPTYKDYAMKGHIEAVKIVYDPSKANYSELLEILWRQINPTDPGGQFCDRGREYMSAIFYNNEEQKKKLKRD